MRNRPKRRGEEPVAITISEQGGGLLSLHCLILNLGKPAIALRTLFRAPADVTDPVKHQSPAVPQIGHQRIARAG